MQIFSLAFLVAPASISIAIIGLTLIPVIGYLKNRFSKQLIRQQCRFDEALIRQEIEISEQSYLRISLELHDRVGHLLSLAKLHLNTGPPAAADEASGLISEALDALRAISRGLTTDAVSCLGLVKTLELLLEEIRKTGMFQISLEQHGEACFLDDQTEIFLYRIAQECLSNIIKHANANVIQIVLDYGTSGFCITISDNGTGFESKSQTRKKGFSGCGLSNIKKRCTIINADLKIRSNNGSGTNVIIKIPSHDKTGAGIKV